jgi:hypothetical protein
MSQICQNWYLVKREVGKMYRQKYAGILLTSILLLTSALPACADESAKIPPLPPPETSPVVLPATVPPITSTPVTATPAATDKSAVSTVAPATSAAAPADPNALLYANNVAPGPFEAKRKILLASIKAAKKQGFGITVYLGEFSKIEEQIKEGKGGPQLEDRIDSIADGLQDQLKRSQILKTQRPEPGGHVSTGGGSTALSGLGSGKSAEMIQQLRAKYGDKVPANLDPSMLNSDAAKEFLKRFKGGN